MERYFIFDKYNTYADWKLIVTAKEISSPEIKTKYVEIDGMSGSLDLTESLSGSVTYKDRPLTTSFWTDYGKRKDREDLFRKIQTALHGRKVKIIEPDDPDHYYLGRINIKSKSNTIAYMTFNIEATCEPWRYAIEETTRDITVNNNDVSIVIHNNGAKKLTPVITVNGNVTLTVKDVSTTLSTGVYTVSNIELEYGANIINVSGKGSVRFCYREADL